MGEEERIVFLTRWIKRRTDGWEKLDRYRKMAILSEIIRESSFIVQEAERLLKRWEAMHGVEARGQI